MADRLEEVPCKGTVMRLLDDEEFAAFKEAVAKSDGMTSVELVPLAGKEPLAVKPVACMLKAKLKVGTHSNPAAILDHGMASNRDAAREGRYDPLNPSRRFMSKGRGWRK